MSSKRGHRIAILILGLSLPVLVLYQNCTDNYKLGSSSALSFKGDGMQEPDPVIEPRLPSDQVGQIQEPPAPPTIQPPQNTTPETPTVPSAMPAGGTPIPPTPGDEPKKNVEKEEEEETETDIVSSTESDPGVCHLNTNQGGSRNIGYVFVDECTLQKEATGKAGKDCNKVVVGLFLAPHTGPTKVCMSQNACENIINAYLKRTDGVLLARPAEVVEASNSQNSQYTEFKANKGYCENSSQAHIRSDAWIESELGALEDYWAKH